MKTIYLDHNATSPASSEHLSKLFEKLSRCAGNPSSPHSIGRNASVALTEARRNVAKSLEVDVAEIIFVSGGTEADNLGTVAVLKQNNIPINQQHVITSTIEHQAIKEPLEQLVLRDGLNLTTLNVDSSGCISLEEVIKNITSKTTLITIMAANNEIGSLQPVKKIGNYLHYKRWGILLEPANKDEFEELSAKLNYEVTEDIFRKLHFHVDAVQIYGKLPPLFWFSAGIDSCAISGHKLGSIQGIGALFLRRGRKFYPFIFGGAQEKNRRAGTENLAGIISFGMISEKILMPYWSSQLKEMDLLRRELYLKISMLPNVVMNSPLNSVVPNTINFSVVGKDYNGEDLLVQLDLHGICVSSGSACSSSANLPSKVILALGKSAEIAKNAIRISLAPTNTSEELNKTFLVLQKFLTK